MKFRTNKQLCLLVFIGLCCSGCALLPERQIPLPILKNPERYLHNIIKKNSLIKDVSGYAKLRISAAGKTSTSRNIFFVRRPDLIRIETLGFLSRPALFFTADSISMSIHVPDSNAFYSGKTTADNLQRIIGMRLELQDIVRAFLGEPPHAECSPEKLSCSQDGGRYLFSSSCQGGEQLIWIDPATCTITGFKLYANKSPAYEYTFSNFQAFHERLFPLKIDIHHYTTHTDITLEFDSLSFDPISPERFSMNTPRGATHIDIEEIGLPQQ